MKNRKRVLFVISGIAYSGAEIVLDSFLKSNDYIEPYFYIVLSNPVVEKRYIDIYGEKLVKCGKHTNQRFFNWVAPLLLKRKIQFDIDKFVLSNKIDNIYINNTFEGFLCSNIKFDKKVIWHIHDMRDSFRNTYWLHLSEKNFNKFDEIICVSNACKKSWNNAKIRVVYNGLEDEWFDGSKIINPKIKKIAIVGRLSMNKGTDILLECIDNLVNKYNLSISFVWNSSEKKLEEILKTYIKKYPNNVFQYKSLCKHEMMKLYDDTDLIVVPSRRDSLPTVIMEASSRKCLVLGNHIAGIPELIFNKECCMDLGDEKKLYNAIENLVTNKNCKDFSDIILKQYNYTKENFSLENKIFIINQMFELE